MNHFVSALQGGHAFPHREDRGLRWQRAAATLLLQPSPCLRKRRGARLAAAVQNCGLCICQVAGFAIAWVALGLALASVPAPAQIVGPWASGMPLPFLQGPTLADTLRNGVQMASDQSRLTAQFAREMGRRTRSAGYQMQNLWADYQNLDYHFQNLRHTFNAVGELALQLQSPRAANAAAELQAGLDIISEAFAPVQQEIQAGTANRDTALRMCQVLDQALMEWQKELKRCSSRLGTIR